ncbi:EcsC family protein [Methylobacterium sp. JK268]
MREIVALDTVPLPASPLPPPPMSDEDRAALREAVGVLERPSFAARLAAVAGAPLDMLGRALPATVTETITHATESVMKASLRAALSTLPRKADGTVAVVAAEAPERSSLRARALEWLERYPPGDRGHRALAAVSGAVGGAFGLATIAVELPVSTTLMLRSIAEIAQREGEDLSQPDAALACLQVFALGGRGGAEPSPTDSGYFAVRGALAKTMSEVARYAAGRGLLDESAPAVMRFVAQVASRFGLVVSQKVAAQAVPVIGAVGGAAVNAAFMDHFQTIARAHFTVRRLERRYGKERVREAYEAERAALVG